MNLASADWLPWEVIPVEGEANGRVAWLTRTGSHGNDMAVGLFTAEPSVFRSTIKEDETIYVISGNVRVEFEDGDAADLSPGDVLWIAKGKKATWHVHSRFEEVFVYST